MHRSVNTILIFFVFLFAGCALVLGYHYWSSDFSGEITKPSITTKFSLANAPSESLRGEIASMSGTVEWLSRTAANPIQVKNGQQIMQGEEVTTGKNGWVVITIQNDAALQLLADTDLRVVQLLPQNFVFVQDKGSIEYQNTQSVPVSIRSFDLVSILNNGTVDYVVDQKEQTITASVKKGSMRSAYEDSQNNSQVMTAQAGQTVQFDETTREGTVQGEPIKQNSGPF